MSDRAFPLLGGVHLAILAATFTLPALLAWVVRSKPLTADPIRHCLALVLATNAACSIWLGVVWRGGFFPESSLPMHFCDWALVATILALVTKKEPLFEVAYFWGLAGTLQAILTPDLSEGLPLLRYWTFFIAHCGIVVGVLFLTWGLRFQTKSWAALRVFGWTQLYLCAAALVNWLVEANFGYLQAKPQGASLLDLLGPWPWYLLAMEVIALLLFTLFDLPFILARRAQRNQSRNC